MTENNKITHGSLIIKTKWNETRNVKIITIRTDNNNNNKNNKD